MGYGLKLATNCITYNDCVFLSNTLAELYGIKSSVQNAGVPNQYHIAMHYTPNNDLAFISVEHVVRCL